MTRELREETVSNTTYWKEAGNVIYVHIIQSNMAPPRGGPAASGRVRVRVRCRNRFAAAGDTDVQE